MNLITGTSGNDTLIGSRYGFDTLVGGQGNDVLQTVGVGGPAELVSDWFWSRELNWAGGNVVRVQADSGHDTLTRTVPLGAPDLGRSDTIELGSDIRLDTLQTQLNGRDLVLSWSDNAQGRSSLTVRNYLQPNQTAQGAFIVRNAAGVEIDIPLAAWGSRTAIAGDDELILGGARGADTLLGGEGSDTLQSGGGNSRIEGQLGSDVVYAGDGHDTVLGGWDDDGLYGRGGNDLLVGGQGNDVMVGGTGDDTLQGGEGADLMQGSEGRNLLQGGAGNDTLIALEGSTFEGGRGDDLLLATNQTRNTFVMGRHGGRDRAGQGEAAYPTPTSPNGLSGAQVVRITDGIRPDEVTLRPEFGGIVHVQLRDGSSSLALHLATGGQLDSVVFDDGTVWSGATLAAQMSITTEGDDQVSVPDGVHLVNGLGGHDRISGQGGDTLAGQQGNDHLSLWTRFDDPAPAGGVLDGGQGNDLLMGGRGADTLIGGTGVDALEGGNGRDVYRFNRGDGQDVITEFSWCIGPDGPTLAQEIQIELGAGIRRDDLQFARRDSDLHIQVLGGPGDADRIILANYFFGNASGQFITLADGTRLGTDVVDAYLAAHPVGSTTNTTGTSGNDTLEAAGEWQVLAGGAGNDTYLWGNQGVSGRIADQSGADVLQLSANIRPEQVHLRLDNSDRSSTVINGWILTADETPGTVRVGSADGTARPFTELPSIRFADGTTWSQDTIIAKLRASLPDQTTWYAGGNDTLSQPLANTDLALGGAGSDTYVVGLSSRLARIVASDITPELARAPWLGSAPANSLYPNPPQARSTDVDTLRLVDGIRPEDVQLSLEANGDLRLRVRHSEVNLVVDQFALNDGRNTEVERVVFDDGTSWSRDTLMTLSQRPQGQGLVMQAGMSPAQLVGEDGHDWLSGSAGRDLLDGGAGRDTLIGGAGNDLYLVDRSDDVVTELAGGGRDTVRASVSMQAGDEIEVVQLVGRADLNATGRAHRGTSLVGNAGNNVLRGGSGFDALSGQMGADTLIGGDDGDHYRVIDARNQIIERAEDGGIDLVISHVDELTLADHVEVLALASNATQIGHGNAGDNTLYANSVGSWLDGRDGDDLLQGGRGEDTLQGGHGDDDLQGGLGSDTYVWQRGDGHDTLFERDASTNHTDTLQLDGVTLDAMRLSMVGRDLRIDIQGADGGSVTVREWGLGRAYHLEAIQHAGGTLDASGIQQLVQAMASSAPAVAASSGIASPSATAPMAWPGA